MNPAIAGATPPPKISPAPTTMPIADEIKPAGAASVAIGPVINATLPRQKNETTNNPTNKATRIRAGTREDPQRHRGAHEADHRHELAAETSDRPGTPNCPKNPPKPSAEVTTPICVGAQIEIAHEIRRHERAQHEHARHRAEQREHAQHDVAALQHVEPLAGRLRRADQMRRPASARARAARRRATRRPRSPESRRSRTPSATTARRASTASR